MSAPHAGGQLKWALRPWDTKFYGFDFSSPTTVNGHCFMEGYDIFNIDYHYRVTYSWQKEGVRKFKEAVRLYEERMTKVMEEKNRKQQVIEEKLSEQQIIEDKISAKIVIDNILFMDCNASYMMPLHVMSSVESQSTANKGGLLCTNHGEVTREVNRKINAEENQKFYAEEEIAQDAKIAQVISEDQKSSSLNYEGTPSLIGLPFISSSLESGGTSLVSSQVLTALFLGTSTSLPTPPFDPTPLLIHPTSTSGGTSAGAPSADNPSIFCFPVYMPLLPPRTGIGVQDPSPPPTASFCSTGVYAIALSASPANVADNPDNPDLAFDPSGTVPDNPCKPASDLWAYVASRG
mmetsp:Transcript_42082/g.87939  ORF Transcript_42082/g.87939 Transcript_42082/m.87939 type:complete len:349 (-) Transcript_42082:218-1264(-)